MSGINMTLSDTICLYMDYHLIALFDSVLLDIFFHVTVSRMLLNTLFYRTSLPIPLH